jgi:uncharacterized protein YhaN
MRLTYLDLIAYGQFTGRTIRFGRPPKSLHVIYGPNEAGKSTVKASIEELLFGFHFKTPFEFLHGYNALKIGARITNGEGASLEFRRRKRNGDNLIDKNDNPIPASALTPFLHGMTQETFCQQFSLSRVQLNTGSREIAEGEGDVGRSLYNAALGNSSLTEILASLEQQKEALFKKRGREQPINRALNAYEAQRGIARESLIRPAAYEKLANERDEHAGKISEIEACIVTTSVEIGLLTTLAAYYPNYDRLTRAKRELEEYAGRAALPSAIVVQAEAFLADLTDLEKEHARASGRIEELNKRIGTGEDSPLFAHGVAIDQLKGFVVTYRKNITELREKNPHGLAQRYADEAKRHLEAAWPGLSLEEARKRISSTEATSRGNALAFEHAQQTTALDNGMADEERLTTHIAQVTEDIDRLPATKNVVNLYGAITTAVGEGRIDSAIATAAALVARKLAGAATALQTLGLFTGTLAEFAVAALPARETVESHGLATDSLNAHLERIDVKEEGGRRKLGDAQEQLDALAKEGDLRTAADLLNSRADRDAIFITLREHWRAHAPVDDLDATATTYTGARTASDDLADSLRLEASRVTRVAAAEAQRDAAIRDLATCIIDRENAATVQGENATNWSAEWVPCKITPRSPIEMRAWLQSAADLRRALSEVEDEQAKLAAARERRTACIASLRAALTDLGASVPASDDLAPVLAIAERILATSETADTERKRLANELQRDHRDVEAARKARKAATEKLTGIDQKLGDIFEGVWLPRDFPPAQFADARATIVAFHTADRKARDDKSRAGAIDRDNDEYRRKVLAFAELHAADLVALAAAAPDSVANTLADRWTAAKTTHDTRVVLQRQLDDERASCAKAAIAIDDVEAELVPIAESVCVPRSDLRDLIVRSKLVNALKQIIGTETAALETGSGRPCAECDALYADQTRDTLNGSLGHANEQLRNLQADRDRINPDLWKCRETLERMDSSQLAADAESAIINTAALIDRDARRYGQLAIASHIIEQQVANYTETQQGTLITRASYYLNLLTGGSFHRLRAVNTGDTNVLNAVNRAGTDITINGLSEGTRDQLFLALRLAALEEHLKANEPQPLILDDTFVHFDDARTRHAFAALAEFSAATQVIYFTHHLACVDAAIAAVPKEMLDVHDLSDETVPLKLSA